MCVRAYVCLCLLAHACLLTCGGRMYVCVVALLFCMHVCVSV